MKKKWIFKIIFRKMDTAGDSHMKQIKLITEDKYIFIFKHIYL